MTREERSRSSCSRHPRPTRSTWWFRGTRSSSSTSRRTIRIPPAPTSHCRRRSSRMKKRPRRTAARRIDRNGRGSTDFSEPFSYPLAFVEGFPLCSTARYARSEREQDQRAGNHVRGGLERGGPRGEPWRRPVAAFRGGDQWRRFKGISRKSPDSSSASSSDSTTRRRSRSSRQACWRNRSLSRDGRSRAS